MTIKRYGRPWSWDWDGFFVLWALERAVTGNPGASIVVVKDDLPLCGFVPHDRNGQTVYFTAT